MNLKKYYINALSYEAYVQLLNENRPLHELHYKKFNVDNDVAQEPFLKNHYKILVITEPWCGDSLALLPLIRKLSEITTTWDLKILLRDKNLELMDKFLTNGARGIPVFLFLDENFDLITRWGPRPGAAQQIYEKHRTRIENGQILKHDVIKKIRSYYAKDRGKESVAELKSLLEDVLITK